MLLPALKNITRPGCAAFLQHYLHVHSARLFSSIPWFGYALCLTLRVSILISRVLVPFNHEMGETNGTVVESKNENKRLWKQEIENRRWPGAMESQVKSRNNNILRLGQQGMKYHWMNDCRYIIFNGHLWIDFGSANPLTPMTDQEEISPYSSNDQADEWWE